MIDFKNTEKYSFKISEKDYDIKIGDKVRCYNADTNDMNHFVGYATVTALMQKPQNIWWCKADPTPDQNIAIDYWYWCMPVRKNNRTPIMDKILAINDDLEELQKCRESNVYFYNKYMRQEGQPLMTEEKMEALMSVPRRIRGRNWDIFPPTEDIQ